MKTIGLIGGISWQSTQSYYHHVNTMVQQKLGTHYSCKMIINSLNFNDVEICIEHGDFPALIQLVSNAAKILESSGAEIILIGANTMHLIYNEIQQQVKVPILHIAEVTAQEIKNKGFHKVALLGTEVTMEKPFLKNLFKKQGINILIPEERERKWLHKLIFEELFSGEIFPESRRRLLEIISNLENEGAQGIILGCTELPLILKQEHTPIPLFDTTFLHSKAAVEFALNF